MNTPRKRFADLSTAERHAFWSEVEASIRALLDDLGHDVPASDREVVLDYLRHNELGVALEHLCDAMIEEGRTVSASQHAEIDRLFRRMEMDPTGRVEHLTPGRRDGR